MRSEKELRKIYLIAIAIILSDRVHAQAPVQKVVNQQVQFWTSINSTFHMSKRWGFLADFHIRRNNFMADPSFYFIRGAGNYWIKDNMTAALGYGHMWVAPAQEGWNTYSNENRIYQQFQASSKTGKTQILQRIRNEQRWQEKIVDDKKTGDWRFTDRVRYLFSVNRQVFRKNSLPSLVVSDEILLQFGKEVVYNTMDQNRFFIGIRQNINSKFSYDFGYMNVYQQKYSGYMYDMNHTIRLFFYFFGGKYMQKTQRHVESNDE
jgi:Protein of unknown function (DUF2490)